MDRHSHVPGDAPQASRKTTIILASIVGAVVLATMIGAASVWPDDQSFRGSVPTSAEGTEWVIAEVLSGPHEGDFGDEFTAIIPDDRDSGEWTLLPTGDVGIDIAPGDVIRALAFSDQTMIFADYVRGPPMLLLLMVYIALVLAVAWWRGAGALIGLAAAFGVVLFFTVPALFGGGSPLVIGLVTGAGALFVLLYMAHGVNARSTTAYLGTLAGLSVTTFLAWWAVDASHLLGVWLETGAHFELLSRDVSLRGLVLCGIVLAGLGILNDVTVTQASAVWELRAARPDISRVDLFWRGMRIGRDHIASTVYTIAFAYVGAALPVIMILSLLDQEIGTTLTSAEIAEEIVRTLVGSIGLVLAVPLTTGIGAAVVGRDSVVQPAVAPGVKRDNAAAALSPNPARPAPTAEPLEPPPPDGKPAPG